MEYIGYITSFRRKIRAHISDARGRASANAAHGPRMVRVTRTIRGQGGSEMHDVLPPGLAILQGWVCHRLSGAFWEIAWKIAYFSFAEVFRNRTK